MWTLNRLFPGVGEEAWCGVLRPGLCLHVTACSCCCCCVVKKKSGSNRSTTRARWHIYVLPGWSWGDDISSSQFVALIKLTAVINGVVAAQTHGALQGNSTRNCFHPGLSLCLPSVRSPVNTDTKFPTEPWPSFGLDVEHICLKMNNRNTRTS